MILKLAVETIMTENLLFLKNAILFIYCTVTNCCYYNLKRICLILCQQCNILFILFSLLNLKCKNCIIGWC